MDRRKFLNYSLIGGLGVMSGLNPISASANDKKTNVKKLTILHTNDVHSRLDPFPMDGSKLQGLGGVTRRTALINNIRSIEPNVILLDCGDVVQGTPYFNMFLGKPEFEIMSQMGYDAGTLGNHDFDLGIEHLAKMSSYANFPLLNVNYNLNDTPIKEIIKPYKIIEKDGIKIGIFGIGIDLKGLVPSKSYEGLQYQDPIAISNATAKMLRYDKKCNLVICLSHLGYNYPKESQKISDVVLAENSSEIDIILGGHTHTFLENPDLRKNKEGEIVLINQVGWAGLRLGKIDILFEKNKKHTCSSCDNIWLRN